MDSEGLRNRTFLLDFAGSGLQAARLLDLVLEGAGVAALRVSFPEIDGSSSGGNIVSPRHVLLLSAARELDRACLAVTERTPVLVSQLGNFLRRMEHVDVNGAANSMMIRNRKEVTRMLDLCRVNLTEVYELAKVVKSRLGHGPRQKKKKKKTQRRKSQSQEAGSLQHGEGRIVV